MGAQHRFDDQSLLCFIFDVMFYCSKLCSKQWKQCRLFWFKSLLQWSVLLSEHTQIPSKSASKLNLYTDLYIHLYRKGNSTKNVKCTKYHQNSPINAEQHIEAHISGGSSILWLVRRCFIEGYYCSVNLMSSVWLCLIER